MANLKASRAAVIGGLLTIYLVWGSTYLAIRIAIETLPPFLMAGGRFLLAGVLLYGWARWRGATKPTFEHWAWAALLGGLLLLGGNGLVTWAEETVPSGLACLIITTVPLWMVLFEGLRPGGQKPTLRVWLGLLCGLVGVSVLVGPGSLPGSGLIDPLGAVALVAAALFWALGSILSRSAAHPPAPLLGTAIQMLCGGVLLLIVGSLSDEWSELNLSTVSQESILAMLYLALFGSILAFSAYVWLLRVTSPALVSTYAFVNPIVAVYLGWAIADEALSPRLLAAAAVIILGVMLITGLGGRSRKGAHLENEVRSLATDSMISTELARPEASSKSLPTPRSPEQG